MQINRIEKITEQKHLNLFSLEYNDRTGRDKRWVFASRSQVPNPFSNQEKPADAVVIVPYHVRENKLVIIKEFRVVLGGYQYGFPAGLKDAGETVEQTGKRELFEETGLEITRVLSQSPAVYSSSGMTDESISLMYVQCQGIPTREFNEDSEDIEVVMLSREDAGKLLKEPEIKFDVKTWIVLAGYAAHGQI